MYRIKIELIVQERNTAFEIQKEIKEILPEARIEVREV